MAKHEEPLDHRLTDYPQPEKGLPNGVLTIRLHPSSLGLRKLAEFEADLRRKFPDSGESSRVGPTR